MIKPIVSVIIPCHNSEKHLKECIESLLLQSYGPENMELIFLNDCSTDQTLSILKAYELKYPESILILDLQQHSGGMVGLVRNIGLSYATGKYVTFVDSDDMCSENMIATLTELIESDNNCDCAGCGAILFSEQTILRKYESFDHTFDMLNPDDKKAYLLTEGQRCSVWGRLYKSDFIKEHSITFSETLHIAEDVNFHFRAMAYAHKISTTSKFLYLYRASENSLVRSVGLSPHYRNSFDAVNDIYADILKTDHNISFKQEWEYLYFVRGIVEVYFSLVQHNELKNTATELTTMIDQLLTLAPDILSNLYVQNATGGDALKKLIHERKTI